MKMIASIPSHDNSSQPVADLACHVDKLILHGLKLRGSDALPRKVLKVEIHAVAPAEHLAHVANTSADPFAAIRCVSEP